MPIINDNWKFLSESYEKVVFIMKEQAVKLQEMYPDKEALQKDMESMKNLNNEIKEAKEGGVDPVALQAKMDN